MTEVCHAVGYSGLGSFSIRFRAVVGESPSQFQSRYAAAGAPRIPGCRVLMAGLVERRPAAPSAVPPSPSSRPRAWSSSRTRRSGAAYGVEALMRDNSGNWMVLVEPRAFTPEDFEGVDLS